MSQRKLPSLSVKGMCGAYSLCICVYTDNDCGCDYVLNKDGFLCLKQTNKLNIFPVRDMLDAEPSVNKENLLMLKE